MKHIIGLLVIFVTLTARGAVADAQQPKKVARICYLGNAVSGRQAIYIKMFRERLRELGYVEGQNLIIDYRYWEGKVERLPELAAEFVRLNCDVIVTQGTEAPEAVKTRPGRSRLSWHMARMPLGVASSRTSRVQVEISRG